MIENVGKFAVNGSKDFVRLIRSTYRSCKIQPDKWLTGTVKIQEVDSDQLPKRGDGGPAWAFSYVPNQRLIRINRLLSPYQKRYSFLHEVGHYTDQDELNGSKKRDLMALMRPGVVGADEEPWRAWVRGPYTGLPAECFAEYFVRMVSDYRPLNQSFFQRRFKAGSIPEGVKILDREPTPEPPPPPPVDPPTQPLPPPPSQEEVDELKRQLADALEDGERMKTAITAGVLILEEGLEPMPPDVPEDPDGAGENEEVPA